MVSSPELLKCLSKLSTHIDTRVDDTNVLWFMRGRRDGSGTKLEFEEQYNNSLSVREIMRETASESKLHTF